MLFTFALAGSWFCLPLFSHLLSFLLSGNLQACVLPYHFISLTCSSHCLSCLPVLLSDALPASSLPSSFLPEPPVFQPPMVIPEHPAQELTPPRVWLPSTAGAVHTHPAALTSTAIHNLLVVMPAFPLCLLSHPPALLFSLFLPPFLPFLFFFSRALPFSLQANGSQILYCPNLS